MLAVTTFNVVDDVRFALKAVRTVLRARILQRPRIRIPSLNREGTKVSAPADEETYG